MGADLAMNPPPPPPLWEQVKRVVTRMNQYQIENANLRTENTQLKRKLETALRRLGERQVE